jgi:hypothetical protein
VWENTEDMAAAMEAAGMGCTETDLDAPPRPRGATGHTYHRTIPAVGVFIKVTTPDGRSGWLERRAVF